MSDSYTYTWIHDNPLENIITEINEHLIFLQENNYISRKLFNVLYVNDARMGSLRILLKVHKKKFSVRPIINYRGHPTSILCEMFDLLLKPFVAECESYIKDSQNLIHDTKDKKFPKNSKLFSCDFESL